MQGVLSKKQPKAMVFGRWKDRYWVLKKDKFKYYVKSDSKHLGVVDFNKVEASVFLLPEDRNYFKITMNGCDKELVFKANNSEIARTWVTTIQDCINQSKGKHLSLSNTDHKFWKNDYLGKNLF
jgi:thiaminase